MSDIADSISELSELWPALAAALGRDTGAAGPGTRAFTAAAVVNADVLTAMVTLDRDVPAVTRAACQAISEPWQPRDLQGCLRQLPRLAGRMHDLGLAAASKRLAGDIRSWLLVTKRALGLRKPDIPIGYACPWADSRPENHPETVMLICAGDEGFLRPGPGGTRVEWVAVGQIYCPSPGCGATWGPSQWPLLGRMLATAATIGA